MLYKYSACIQEHVGFHARDLKTSSTWCQKCDLLCESLPSLEMAAFNITSPEPFSFTQPENWENWIRRFDRFRRSSGLAEKSQPDQVNTLIYSMGNQAEDILLSFRLSEEEVKIYSTVVEKFHHYFVRRRNIIYERSKFNQRIQESGETVDSFITD